MSYNKKMGVLRRRRYVLGCSLDYDTLHFDMVIAKTIDEYVLLAGKES
jgi:hypothetical protein